MDKDVVHIHNGMLLSHNKNVIKPFYSNMDGPRDCHTVGRKTEEDKYMILLICGI